MAIIRTFHDGTILASKWICDRLIQAKKKTSDPLTTIDKSCGTCEYSLKEEDILNNNDQIEEDYYEDYYDQIGSCCLGKTPEEQVECKYFCEQYRPDAKVIENTYKILLLSNKKKKR